MNEIITTIPSSFHIFYVKLYNLLLYFSFSTSSVHHSFLQTLQMQAESGFKSWFYSIPPFTRTYLVILLLTGLGGSWGLFDPSSLLFVRDLVLKRFEV